MNEIVSKLKIKIFADGADMKSMLDLAMANHIKGLTTNPTLMHKAGIKNYSEFAREVIAKVNEKPISFEVFSDDLGEMKKQAEKIASWGQNVYVKIPITNSNGFSTGSLIRELSDKGIKLNITAIFTEQQTEKALENLNDGTPSYISIFSGRIADTGRNPVPIINHAIRAVSKNSHWEVIWASPRELLNVFQAEESGCHIITATKDILDKLKIVGKDLSAYSLETVQMFKRDAEASKFSI
jgi:transaldolase